MAETEIDESGDRLIVRLDPGGPIELIGLTESFAALARIYERHYRQDYSPAPKLYITRLTSGSIIAEIAPLVPILGAAYVAAGGSVTIADFARRLRNGIHAFADMDTPKLEERPPVDDAADLREFVKPLTGKNRASLGITHARIHTKTADKEVVAEYNFDSDELNRAAINMDTFVTATAILDMRESLPSPSHRIQKEVMLFFEQASRKPAKEEGRTGDRAVIPEIDDKPHPTYFRKGVNDLKDQMVKGSDNPLTSTFVVDVHVQIVDGKIKGYLVTDVHKVIPDE